MIKQLFWSKSADDIPEDEYKPITPPAQITPTQPSISADKVSSECESIPHKPQTIKKNVADRMSQAILRERMSANFPATYLTMVSIIQGVAVGVLAQKLFGEFVDMANFLKVIPLGIISLMLIIVISYEYVWFTAIYRWSIKIMDTVTPIMLGILEIGPLYFLDQPTSWWMMNGILTVCGTLAYFHTYRNCTREQFSDDEDGAQFFRYAKHNIRVSMLMTTIAFIVCFLAGISLLMNMQYLILQPFCMFGENLSIGVFHIAYLSILMGLLFKDTRFVKYLHDVYKVNY